jgi:hypothetical protein
VGVPLGRSLAWVLLGQPSSSSVVLELLLPLPRKKRKGQEREIMAILVNPKRLIKKRIVKQAW